MKKTIYETAYKLGIESVGITNSLDYSHLKDILINRKKNNEDCEFEEEDIDKRLDTKRLFPQCKSIIAIGVPYGLGYKKPLSLDKGLLSVSSLGEDYHKKVNRLLDKLAREIMKLIDFTYIALVDTSFLIDKEICKKAGIGQYGKNSLLINEVHGSFMHLGYLLTDIDIDGDTIEDTDICGKCNICVKSCPNGAIFNEGGINSRKCISYLTQTKSYIPLEYRKNMGNQIYGCDMCQIVCPKNQVVLKEKPAYDYKDLVVDLEELLFLSNRDFLKKYGHMAGSWRGKNVWKRNALISIGNLGLKRFFQQVKNELDNPSQMIKIYAAWSLLKLDKTLASDILYNKFKYEEEKIKNEYLKLMEAKL